MKDTASSARLKPIRSVAVLSNSAISILNFRGPLIKAMLQNGLQVYALAPDYDDATRRAVSQLGANPVDITLERTGMNVVRDLRDGLRLVSVLSKLKPDALFSYFAKPVVYGTLAASLAGVRRRYALVAGLGYVYTPAQGGETMKRRILQILTAGLYLFAFKFCDRVFVQNSDDLEFFIKNRIVEPSKAVCLAGTGVDLEEWSPAPTVTTPPTFLLMARLLRAKGIVEFVEAARVVRRSHPDARFLLLGGLDPNPDGLTAEEVESWRAEGVIEWIGHVADVRPWIAQSSVYVLPSYYREGKPRSTQEAMAMGRPIVTTDLPGCRDTVVSDVNGFLVPPRDPLALAAALTRFIEEPDLVRQMGEASRRLAEQRFDVKAINAVMLAEMGIRAGATASGDNRVERAA